jgi:hypothetical protein
MRYQAAPLPDIIPAKVVLWRAFFLDQSTTLIETLVGPEGFEPPT